jgi:hypothetical protein
LIIIALYALANLAYLAVLPLRRSEIQSWLQPTSPTD